MGEPLPILPLGYCNRDCRFHRLSFFVPMRYQVAFIQMRGRGCRWHGSCV